METFLFFSIAKQTKLLITIRKYIFNVTFTGDAGENKRGI